MTRKSTRRYLKIGPGGMGCPCCAPPQRSRRKFIKTGKLREGREAFKVERAEIEANEKPEDNRI